MNNTPNVLWAVTFLVSTWASIQMIISIQFKRLIQFTWRKLTLNALLTQRIALFRWLLSLRIIMRIMTSLILGLNHKQPVKWRASNQADKRFRRLLVIKMPTSIPWMRRVTDAPTLTMPQFNGLTNISVTMLRLTMISLVSKLWLVMIWVHTTRVHFGFGLSWTTPNLMMVLKWWSALQWCAHLLVTLSNQLVDSTIAKFFHHSRQLNGCTLMVFTRIMESRMKKLNISCSDKSQSI